MTSRELYLRLLHYVKPHRRMFALSLVGTVVLALTEPAIAALLKPLLDGSFVARDPEAIRDVPLLLIGLFLIRSVADFTGAVSMKWVATRTVTDLRCAMLARLLQLPTRYYDRHPSATLLSKITYDVTQVMTACTDALVTLVKDGVSVLGLLAWMFYLNWKLSLLTLAIAPLIALVMRLSSRRLRQLSRRLQGEMGELNRVVEEVLTGHKVVKIFGGQDYERARFFRTANWVRRLQMKLATSVESSVPGIQLLGVLALTAVIYLASLESAQGNITVGGFVSLFGAMAMMFAPIKRLTRVNDQLQRGLAAAESIFALLDATPEPDTGTRALGRARGEVRFEDVHFSYASGAAQVLAGIDLDVRAGETVALVGASGSGKTTLMALLPRLYEPSAGRIRIDGIDIAELTLASLRANIAYVSQDIVLFNDSVAANIAYGSATPPARAAIEAAAAAAHAMEFIREMPDGLDTVIGERGTRLSGGQRQRIAIARALLKNAPILILDEATSALDTHSERQVQQALERLREGRTAFIIAHRLSTIENADRIVVMQKGAIVEIGTHAELLARDGVYAGLHRLQETVPSGP
ncbi:lipid A export permease/ATP-binding protein MsbA [Plasticicumulans lactativorans]|nr:lipid A export permease/ATP-binding protein MsbA [Plasticicumulans lactativorans]